MWLTAGKPWLCTLGGVAVLAVDERLSGLPILANAFTRKAAWFVSVRLHPPLLVAASRVPRACWLGASC